MNKKNDNEFCSFDQILGKRDIQEDSLLVASSASKDDNFIDLFCANIFFFHMSINIYKFLSRLEVNIALFSIIPSSNLVTISNLSSILLIIFSSGIIRVLVFNPNLLVELVGLFTLFFSLLSKLFLHIYCNNNDI